jgi:hypothetical protein
MSMWEQNGSVVVSAKLGWTRVFIEKLIVAEIVKFPSLLYTTANTNN